VLIGSIPDAPEQPPDAGIISGEVDTLDESGARG
jgi:hypothetical protein